MPFDKISPSTLFVARVVLALTFLGVGGGLAWLGGGCVLDAAQCTTRFTAEASQAWSLMLLVYGVALVNAGSMLLEWMTRPPLKVGISVPFMAANFQVALMLGIVALGLTVAHVLRDGEMAPVVGTLQTLCAVGFALNLFFVVWTKLRWNYTANTGKSLPE